MSVSLSVFHQMLCHQANSIVKLAGIIAKCLLDTSQARSKVFTARTSLLSCLPTCNDEKIGRQLHARPLPMWPSVSNGLGLPKTKLAQGT